MERHNIDNDNDEQSSDGEIDSSHSEIQDNDEIESKNEISQSWTKMLTEHNLSSIMSNALADDSQIIHIDDPIAQQSDNPLSYVFPPGTDPVKYFQRKIEQDAKHRISRRDLKNLANVLHREKNEDLLRTVMETIGKARAFEYAQKSIDLYKNEKLTMTSCVNGEKRSLGGFYFKLLMSKEANDWLNQNERELIQRRNRRLQKEKRKQRKKNAKQTNSI